VTVVALDVADGVVGLTTGRASIGTADDGATLGAAGGVVGIVVGDVTA
jgi:hypothetical protein